MLVRELSPGVSDGAVKTAGAARPDWSVNDVLDQIEEGFLAASADLVVAAVNRPAEQLLRCDREALLNRPLLDVLPETEGSTLRERLAGVVRGESPAEVECCLGPKCDADRFRLRLFRLGEGVGVLLRLAPPSDEEAERRGCRECVDERVIVRTRELEESQTKLRQAERLAALGTLAAGLAHQLNNPIGAVLLAAQNARLLQAIPSAKAEFQACLEDIVGSAERCAAVVRDMLRFAETKASEKWPMLLNPIVESAVEAARPYLVKRKADVRLELADDLPPALLSPLSIEQVLVNLHRNAADSAVDRVHIEICTAATRTGLQLVVRDDGRGMSEEERRRVFDPFFTTRDHQGAAGMGLSLVHGIIREHGGSIDVQSTPGRGTTFTVLLPQAGGAAREN
jgi:signal transduction histidine kinase